MATSTQACQLRFVERRVEPVKQLPGFQKHHRVPTSATHSDQVFIANLAAPQLDEQLQQFFTDLRRAYGLKRKEISVDGPYEGTGIIQTPFFKFSIQMRLDENQPSQVVTTRSISDVVEPARIFAGPFDEVFGTRFHSLEVATSEPLDLEAIVDAIEDAENENVSVDYDKDLTWCEINVLNSATTVVIEENLIRIESTSDTTPQELLASFVSVQQQFIESLPFDRSGFEV